MKRVQSDEESVAFRLGAGILSFATMPDQCTRARLALGARDSQSLARFASRGRGLFASTWRATDPGDVNPSDPPCDRLTAAGGARGHKARLPHGIWNA
jgi:hypothetical protein